MMQETKRIKQLQAFAGALDALVAFADEEEEFVLAAKLENARVFFEARYGTSTR